MRVALLSPGPSLANAPSVFPKHDAILAVNQAVLIARADWWCFGDAETFWRWQPDYTPTIWTDHNAARRVLKSDSSARFERHRRDTYEAHFSVWHNYPTDWTRFSACAALVRAATLGASDVDCFGVDMSGGAYHDGATSGTLNDDRWATERRLWAETVSLLNHRGIAVNRL